MIFFLIGAPSLASIAKWQDELEYTVDLDTPGKHVLAVVFFTPEGTSGDTELAVSTSDSEGKYGKTIKRILQKFSTSIQWNATSIAEIPQKCMFEEKVTLTHICRSNIV